MATVAERLKRRLAERKARRRHRKGLLARARKLAARAAQLAKRIAALNGAIKRDRQILHRTPGEKAADYLLRFVGRTEIPPGSNDAPFLAQWRAGLPTLAWMKGQPWCGFACIAAWHYGAGKRLPDGTVYTPNIVAWAKAGTNFRQVAATEARKGDLVVFNFPGGSPTADHVGLALGPARAGLIPTVEGNTSPDNNGSQGNGGGVFRRERPLSQVALVARPL